MKGSLMGILSVILILVTLLVVANYLFTKPGEVGSGITSMLDCYDGQVIKNCLCGDQTITSGYCCNKEASDKPCGCPTTKTCSDYKLESECKANACGLAKTCTWAGGTCA